MSRRALIALLLGPIWACHQGADLSLPIDDNSRALILIAAPVDLPPEVYAIDLEGAPKLLPLAGRDGEVLIALVYEQQSLGALAIRPGPLARPGEGQAGRPLPGASRYLRAELPATSFVPVDDDVLAPILDRIRIEGLRPSECERANGCFRFLDGVETCELPCVEPAAPMPPQAPAPPALPVLTPCPVGWQTWVPDPISGALACRPPPSAGCPDGQFQPPSRAACEPIGAACPVGDWPTRAPAGAVYVSATPGVGGSGSQADPFHDLSLALATAPAGSTLLLSKGEHLAGATLTASVTIAGACAAETRVAGTGIGILVRGTGSVLRDLGVVVGGQALLLQPDSTLELRGVELLGGGSIAVSDGATLNAARLRVRPGASPLLLLENGLARLSHGVFEQGTGIGLQADGPRSRLRIDDVRIEGEGSNNDQGRKSVLLKGAGLEANALYILHSPGGPMALFEAGTATISDVLIEASGSVGHGIDLYDAIDPIKGSHLRASRVTLTQVQSIGILLNTYRNRAVLEDVIVVGAKSGAVNVTGGSTLSVTRAVFASNESRGATIQAGARASFFDLRVLDTQRDVRGGGGGDGFRVDDAELSVTRAELDHNLANGLIAVGSKAPARVSLTDVRVTRSLLRDGEFGIGLCMQHGSVLSGQRLWLEDNEELGILLDYSQGSTLSDVNIVGSGGTALRVKRSHLYAQRIHLGANGCAPLRAISGVIEVEDLLIEGPTGDNCGDPNMLSGLDTDKQIVDTPLTGVVIDSDWARGGEQEPPLGRLIATRFLIRNQTRFGMIFGGGGEAEFTDGEISDCAAGIGSHLDGFDGRWVPPGVIFRRNGENISPLVFRPR